MNQTYYKRWGILMRTPFYQQNLRRWYESGFNKIAKLTKNENPFDAPNFTALLSECWGEKTAETFANFVFSKNPTATVIILDINSVSIDHCKTVLPAKFLGKSIKFLCKDILDSGIPGASIDYIETDGFLQFFEPKTMLPKLISEWARMLKFNGYITTRAVATSDILQTVIIKGLYKLFCPIFKVPAYHQTLEEIINTFKNHRCLVDTKNTWIPMYKQMTMVKDS